MNKLVLPSILGVIGLLLILLATLLGWVVVPNIIKDQIEKEIRLIPGTSTYEKWEKNPFPAFIEFYMFNITNPTFMDDRVLPKFEEFGPFVYEEIRLKDQVQINDDGDTLTYVQRITYIFREDLSNGSVYEPVYTTLNAPFLIVVQAIYEALGPSLANYVIDPFFLKYGESFVRTHVSVDELIFNGFPLIPSYEFFLSFLPEPPAEFGGNRFAFYRGKNGSIHDGTYKIKSGITNSQDFARVVTWEGQSILNFWKSPDPSNEIEDVYCNYINGTDGSIFPPFIKKDEPLRMFVTDLCRSIVLEYEKDVEHLNIPGYRFVLPNSFYQDPAINGDNYCFCTSPPGDLEKRCGEGIIRLFPCKDGAPIVVSSPHFLSAGQEFIELGQLMGLSPDYEKHHTRVDIEPNTGATLSVAKKLQANIEIQTLTNVPYFNNINHSVIPLFWANEFADIDDKLASEIRSDLLTPLSIVNVSRWSILGVGGILVIASGIVFVLNRRRINMRKS